MQASVNRIGRHGYVRAPTGIEAVSYGPRTTGYRLRWTVPGGHTWTSPGVWRQAAAAQRFADSANATEEMLHVVVEPVEVEPTHRFVDR